MRDLLTHILETLPQFDPDSKFHGATDMCPADIFNNMANLGAMIREELDKPAPTLTVTVANGTVHAIVTDQPSAFEGVRAIIVDYDTYEADHDDNRLRIVPQSDGSLSSAYIADISICQTGIDLIAVKAEIDGTAYGSGQTALAACGDHPCEGCTDCNSDGDRCVNENKCLAWQFYMQESH